jgi:PAS domain S-box-containing protein
VFQELSEAQRLAQLGSWHWDSEADLVTWSDQLFRIAGRDPSSSAPSYKEHWPLYTPESWEQLQRAVEEALRTGAPYELDLEMVRPDGTTRWVCARGEAERDAMGRITRLRGTVQDITERKQSEEKLRELGGRLTHADEEVKKSEEKVFKAFRQSPVALTITSAKDHRYLEVSESFERWSGWRHDEVMGRTPFDIAIWVNPAQRLEFVRRILADGVVRNLEFRFRSKQGEEMVGLGSGALIEIANEPCIISAVADITERKHAERELSQINERLNLAMEAGGIGGWEWNLKDGRSFWFCETHKLLGISGGDARSASADEFRERVHPEDRDWLRDAVQKAMRNHTELNVEFRVVWPDGSVHWLRSRARFFYGIDGEAERMLGISVDITERKRAEEALSGVTRQLVEAQEQERSRIGRELHDDVSQRLALLSISLGQLEDKNNLPFEVWDAIQELKQMTSNIATDIHVLSHELHPSNLEYLGLVSGVRGWCEEYGKRHELEIDFKSDELPPLRQEVSLCLFRVLQEALHNAAKHSGVKRIEVQLVGKSDEIHLIVRDSGKGFDIDAARQKRGLGLTSMQERVRLIGGTMVIESKPMAGTVVYVCVPFRAEHRGQSAAA